MAADVKIKISAENQSALQAFDALSGKVSGLNGLIAGLGRTVIAYLGVHRLAAVSRSMIDAADQIGKLGQKAGVATEDMNGLAFAAERNQVGVETLRMGLKDHSLWLLKNGQDTRDLTTALIEQSAIFSQMPDGVNKTALAVERFGRAGQELIPFLNEGPERLRALMQRAQQLAPVTRESAAQATAFNDALTEPRSVKSKFLSIGASGGPSGRRPE